MSHDEVVWFGAFLGVIMGCVIYSTYCLISILVVLKSRLK